MRIITLLFCLLLGGCTFIKDPDKKIFIKSVQFEDMTVDWYIYSTITSFSPAKIQIEKDGHIYQIIKFGYGVSNIGLENHVLTIQTTGKREFEIDKMVLNKFGLETKFDTTGKPWNESTARFSRLQGKKVEILKRHFVESYGTNYGN
jgi:hypothetical protein